MYVGGAAGNLYAYPASCPSGPSCPPLWTGTAGPIASSPGSPVVNVTVTEPSAGGWLTVFPAGTTRPLASSINFVPGQTIANAVVAKVGTGGQVDIYNFQGNTHVIVDVQGWFG